MLLPASPLGGSVFKPSGVPGGSILVGVVVFAVSVGLTPDGDPFPVLSAGFSVGRLTVGDGRCSLGFSSGFARMATTTASPATRTPAATPPIAQPADEVELFE